jgi:hypothetical protein
MSVVPQADDTARAEPPLWSIGLAVVVILVAPVVLYSLAPTGPLREGDTIFSDGQQRVLLAGSAASAGPSQPETCLLDPDSPLIIIQRPAERADATILAQVQGNPAIEWPFCPLHAEVLLRAHQIFQKLNVLGGAKNTLVGIFGK